MSWAVKTSTGLTGLAVAVNPHYTLGVLYGKILRVLQKMPETAVYRKYTEDIVKERAGVLKSVGPCIFMTFGLPKTAYIPGGHDIFGHDKTENVQEVEKKIGCGQAEELIIQAENELLLARKMLNWKPWEPLAEKPPKGQWDWPPTK